MACAKTWEDRALLTNTMETVDQMEMIVALSPETPQRVLQFRQTHRVMRAQTLMKEGAEIYTEQVKLLLIVSEVILMNF